MPYLLRTPVFILRFLIRGSSLYPLEAIFTPDWRIHYAISTAPRLRGRQRPFSNLRARSRQLKVIEGLQVKMSLGKVARKLRRTGKTAYQFRFTSTFEYIELGCNGTWWVDGEPRGPSLTRFAVSWTLRAASVSVCRALQVFGADIGVPDVPWLVTYRLRSFTLLS